MHNCLNLSLSLALLNAHTHKISLSQRHAYFHSPIFWDWSARARVSLQSRRKRTRKHNVKHLVVFHLVCVCVDLLIFPIYTRAQILFKHTHKCTYKYMANLESIHYYFFYYLILCSLCICSVAMHVIWIARVVHGVDLLFL